jgi:hypothetical protein
MATVNIYHVATPKTVVFKSFPNSLDNSVMAVAIPTPIQVETKVYAMIAENANDFFHTDQLRGSLGLSEG